MADKKQIITLLAKGYKATQVAEICAVSDAYISQLGKEEGFSEAVTAARQELIMASTKIDNTYQSIEEKATAKILQNLNLYNPMQLIAVATMANKAARKQPSASDIAGTAANQSATITLPLGLAGLSITVNSQNNVLEVAGTSLAIPDKEALNDLVASRS